MSDESTSIRDGCVAPQVSDHDDTMVGTLGPTETEAGASPKGEGDDHDDGPAFEFNFDPTDETEAEASPRGDDRTYNDGPGLELTFDATETEAEASPREDYDAPAEHIGPEPEQLKRKAVGVPGYHYIRRTRRGRFEVQIKGVGQGSGGRVYLGTVDTLKEAVELYNDVARTQGKPAQKLRDEPDPGTEPDPIHPALPASDVPEKTQSVEHEHKTDPDLAPDAKRQCLALAEFEAPKTATAVHGKGKDKWTKTAIPAGLKNIKLTKNGGRYSVCIYKRKNVQLGVMDTLHGALWLYNTEARKIGKPTQTLPDGFSPVVKSESIPTDELHVPELNNTCTAIPGLNNINFMTADGSFRMAFQTPSSGYVSSHADSLDEAVKAYNEARSKGGLSTHTITAEHRAVVKEMERKREVFITKPPKKRKMTARQYDKAHAAATTRLRPRPKPSAEKVRPPRAKTPKKPAGAAKESAPAEMTSAGGASAVAAAPAHLDQSAELDRLRDENEQLLEMNESLLAMAQRVMGMAARRSLATQ